MKLLKDNRLTVEEYIAKYDVRILCNRNYVFSSTSHDTPEYIRKALTKMCDEAREQDYSSTLPIIDKELEKLRLEHEQRWLKELAKLRLEREQRWLKARLCVLSTAKEGPPV